MSNCTLSSISQFNFISKNILSWDKSSANCDNIFITKYKVHELWSILLIVKYIPCIDTKTNLSLNEYLLFDYVK